MPFPHTPSIQTGGRLQVPAVLRGVVFTFVMGVVLSGLVALAIYFTSLREQQASGALLVAGLLAVATGGGYAARAARAAGWLHGGLVGLLYTMATTLLSPALFPGALHPGPVLERLVVGCAVGMVGGILGVNL